MDEITNIDGVTWRLDPERTGDGCIDREIQKCGVWEKMSTRWVKKIVKPKWRCLDIGANIGYYTILLSRLVGEKGKVVAFEPDMHRYMKLLFHCGVNDLFQAQPINLALGLRKPLFEREIIRGLIGKKVDFIKVDVDGPDLAIWKMLKPIIYSDRGPHAILFELCDYTLQKHEGTAEYGFWCKQLLTLISSCGYELRHERGWKVITDFDELISKRPYHRNSDNIFGIKRDSPHTKRLSSLNLP